MTHGSIAGVLTDVHDAVGGVADEDRVLTRPDHHRAVGHVVQLDLGAVVQQQHLAVGQAVPLKRDPRRTRSVC